MASPFSSLAVALGPGRQPHCPPHATSWFIEAASGIPCSIRLGPHIPLCLPASVSRCCVCWGRWEQWCSHPASVDAQIQAGMDLLPTGHLDPEAPPCLQPEHSCPFPHPAPTELPAPVTAGLVTPTPPKMLALPPHPNSGQGPADLLSKGFPAIAPGGLRHKTSAHTPSLGLHSSPGPEPSPVTPRVSVVPQHRGRCAQPPLAHLPQHDQTNTRAECKPHRPFLQRPQEAILPNGSLRIPEDGDAEGRPTC